MPPLRPTKLRPFAPLPSKREARRLFNAVRAAMRMFRVAEDQTLLHVIDGRLLIEMARARRSANPAAALSGLAQKYQDVLFRFLEQNIYKRLKRSSFNPSHYEEIASKVLAEMWKTNAVQGLIADSAPTRTLLSNRLAGLAGQYLKTIALRHFSEIKQSREPLDHQEDTGSYSLNQDLNLNAEMRPDFVPQEPSRRVLEYFPGRSQRDPLDMNDYALRELIDERLADLPETDQGDYKSTQRAYLEALRARVQRRIDMMEGKKPEGNDLIDERLGWQASRDRELAQYLYQNRKMKPQDVGTPSKRGIFSIPPSLGGGFGLPEEVVQVALQTGYNAAFLKELHDKVNVAMLQAAIDTKRQKDAQKRRHYLAIQSGDIEEFPYGGQHQQTFSARLLRILQQEGIPKELAQAIASHAHAGTGRLDGFVNNLEQLDTITRRGRSMMAADALGDQIKDPSMRGMVARDIAIEQGYTQHVPMFVSNLIGNKPLRIYTESAPSEYVENLIGRELGGAGQGKPFTVSVEPGEYTKRPPTATDEEKQRQQTYQRQMQKLQQMASWCENNGMIREADAIDEVLRTAAVRVAQVGQGMVRTAGLENLTGQHTLDLDLEPSSRVQEGELSFSIRPFEHGGPYWMLIASVGSKKAGHITFGIKDRELHIGEILINRDLRRRGLADILAQKMLAFLREHHPDIQKAWGMFLHRGSLNWARKHLGEPTELHANSSHTALPKEKWDSYINGMAASMEEKQRGKEDQYNHSAYAYWTMDAPQQYKDSQEILALDNIETKATPNYHPSDINKMNNYWVEREGKPRPQPSIERWRGYADY